MPAGSESEFLAPEGPRVFAHRGLAVAAPENTHLAFVKALAAGATHIETDVHVSLDDVAVLSHDPDLARLTGKRVLIEQLTMAELRRVPLGSGQSFVSLAEALDAFPDTRFNIDVKVERAAEPTARAILESRATSRVLITSFSERYRQKTVRLLPGVATSASTRVAIMALTAASLGLHGSLRRVLRGICAVQVPERVRFVRVVTPRFVRAMHDAGVEVHVWTVNRERDMIRLLDVGVDGIVTDRTDIAASLISRRD
jgi:glycerophosphoryl diester phosphodiesterase